MGTAGRKELERLDAVFVQNGAAFSAHDDEISLHGLADATIYFTNRPRREAGHIPSHRFLELWNDGDESFAADPPHAVISFLDDEPDAPGDVTVILREPSLTGHQLTYKVDVLTGKLPLLGGPCSLFIDAFGSSMAPVSAAATRRQPRRPA